MVSMEAAMIQTNFDPSREGFHFDNGTFKGTWSVFCGGMTYAALDYRKYKVKLPGLTKAPAEGNPLQEYLYSRQATAHFYTWHKFVPTAFVPVVPIIGPIVGAVASPLVQGSCEDLESYLSSQGPVVIGLRKDGGGHHVLAIGCDAAKQTIDLYDNNHHDKRSQLTLKNGKWIHSNSTTQWAGWFFDWGHYSDGARFPPLGWRYCTKCHGLFTDSFERVHRCAAGGSHSANQAFEYFLPWSKTQEEGDGERGWRLCGKCMCLFFSPSGQPTGYCADGQNHIPATKSGILLAFSVRDSGNPGEKMWFKCNLCFGLFWAGNGNGTCDVGGTHEKSNNQYAVDHRTA